MAHPRRVLPGRTYLLTRRCIDRRYLLKPSPIVEQILRYALAVAAQRYCVEVHAFNVLSNHYHLTLTDTRGLLPRFTHWFHSIVARFLNAHYGRFECFWAPGSYSAVELVGPEDVLDKTAYLLANGVAAGLVERGTAWPGLVSHPRDLFEGSGVYRAKRPEFFFSPRTRLPEHAELTVSCPPALRGLPRATVVQSLEEKREEKESAARERLRQKRIRFLGRSGIMGQSPFDRPRSREPRFQLSPNVACRDRWKRIERLLELKQFRLEYRQAYVRYRSGQKKTLFPEGTWGPVELYGARARGAPRPRAA